MPGARSMLLSGLLGRLPFSMLPVGLVIAGEAVTGSYARAGIVSAAFSVAAAVIAPVTGRLVDRFGQRRTGSLLLSVFLTAGSGVLAILQTARALWLLAPLAALAGATLPNVGTYTRVRWGSVSRASELETVQALESIDDEASFLIGPPAATLIALVAPTVAVGLGVVLGGIGTVGVLRSRIPEAPRDRSAPPRTAVRGWLDGRRLLVLLAMVGLGATLNGILVATVASTEELGRPGFASVVFALNSTTSFAAAIVVGRMTFRSPARRRVTLGAVAYAATVAPFALVDGLIPLAVAGAVAGLAIAPLFIQVNAFVATTSRPEQLTEAFSWIPASVGVGLALGSAGMGAAVDRLGAGGARTGVLLLGLLPLLFAALGELPGPSRRPGRRAGDASGRDG